MKFIHLFAILLLLGACSKSEYSVISIRNNSEAPIFALPYVAEYTTGEWIEPGRTDEFYSIGCDCMDGFEYFSFYYDSLIIILEDQDQKPVKFYKDGRTVNYDPTMNPFTNSEAWIMQEFSRSETVSEIDPSKSIYVHEFFFRFDGEKVKSLNDTVWSELQSAP